MAKKEIPGAVHIVVGAAMVLMSVFIDPVKLSLFILAGAVIIVWGFFKIISREKRVSQMHRTHHQAQAKHHHQQAQHSAHHKPSHVQHTQVTRCASCGVKIHPLFKWCPNCGHKLK